MRPNGVIVDHVMVFHGAFVFDIRDLVCQIFDKLLIIGFVNALNFREIIYHRGGEMPDFAKLLMFLFDGKKIKNEKHNAYCQTKQKRV